jgi:hypothetical protein
MSAFPRASSGRARGSHRGRERMIKREYTDEQAVAGIDAALPRSRRGRTRIRATRSRSRSRSSRPFAQRRACRTSAS